MDTIFALATARGKAGLAVVRVSGPRALQAGEAMAGTLPAARGMALRRLRDGEGNVLDDALVLRFERGASFTGEDVVEFHLHGSTAVVNAVLDRLAGMAGLRQAEAGEFTRRALENGCLDLSQVEGLADLIESETEAQRKQALRVFEGALGKLVDGWRKDLIRAAALLEATLDFADEDVPVDVAPEVLSLLSRVRQALRAEINGSHVAERLRDGFEVAIVGKPNIGKSTLLNRLAGREAAITSSVAGTTRDVIEVRMDLHGLPVTLLDTAGLRETNDPVEGLGVARARKRAEQADLRVFLVDDDGVAPLDVSFAEGDLVVYGKADLYNNNNTLSVSGLTGEGIDNLISKISQTLESRVAEAATATRLRHRKAMEKAATLLESAAVHVRRGPEVTELAAEDLRLATRALDSLVGRVDVEDLLDEIFASFCIGK